MAAKLLYRLVVAAVAGEAVLQVADRWPVRLGPLEAPGQAAVAVGDPAAAGRALDHAAAPAPADGTLRLALLGCEPAVGAAIERRLRAESSGGPVEVVAAASASSYWSDALDAQLAERRPNIVLAWIVLDRDLATQTASASLFDAGQLRSLRLWSRWWAPAGESAPTASVGQEVQPTREAFVGQCGRRLAAWRTPMDLSMQPAWSELESQLDRLVARCQAERLPLAVVVSPSPLQVNRVLAETVLRECGVDGAAVDWELPERRLAAFAQGRRVPLIDLLPALRRSAAAPHVRHSVALSEPGRELAAQSVGLWLRGQENLSLAASGK